MSTWGKDFYDNENKQKVRKELWIPCFNDIVPRVINRKQFKREFRYLCLPGSGCIFIKKLLLDNIITENTYIVGIERSRSVAPQIKKFLSANFSYGLSHIHIGTFENLCRDNNVLANRFCNRFPFDIANIDIEGSYHSVSKSNGSSFYFEGLDRFLLNQAARIDDKPFVIKEFYLIITSNLIGKIPYYKLKAYKGSFINMLKEEVIRDYRDNFGIQSLDVLLSSDTSDIENYDDKISVISCLLRLMTIISRNFRVKLSNIPYCYKGHSGGAKMGCMTFLCEKLRSNIGENGIFHRERKKNLEDAVEKAYSTNFLREP